MLFTKELEEKKVTKGILIKKCSSHNYVSTFNEQLFTNLPIRKESKGQNEKDTKWSQFALSNIKVSWTTTIDHTNSHLLNSFSMKKVIAIEMDGTFL